MLLLAAPSTAAAQPASSAPSRAQLRTCLVHATPETCLDDLFRRDLTGHTTQEALRLLDRYQADDGDLRHACHPVVHAIGRETFRIQKSVHAAFQVCDGTCVVASHAVPPEAITAQCREHFPHGTTCNAV